MLEELLRSTLGIVVFVTKTVLPSDPPLYPFKAPPPTPPVLNAAPAANSDCVVSVLYRTDESDVCCVDEV